MNLRDWLPVKSLRPFAKSSLLRLSLLAIIVAATLPDPFSFARNVTASERIADLFRGVNAYHLIAAFGVLLLLSSLTWGRARSSIQRYFRTIRAGIIPPFSAIDWVLFLFIASGVLLFVRHRFHFRMFLSADLLIVGGSFAFFHLLSRRAARFTGTTTDLLSDNPIQSSGADELGRGEFVNDLGREIAGIAFDDSFVFALTGEWGEGKTSVVNMLRENLAKNPSLLVVAFDPWNYKDEEAILKAFYAELERAIRQAFMLSGLRKAVGKYLAKISPEVSPFGLKLSLPFAEEEGLEDVKHRIERYISRLGKKVVIIIDDIDRLQAGEMLLIFKVIRLGARFPNTIFLLSYDETIVKKSLRRILRSDQDFLEKVVQKPISLPVIEQRLLNDFTLARIDNFLIKIGIPDDELEVFRNDFADIYRRHIRKLITTLRDAKRYLNGLLPGISVLKNEIDVFDYCCLEVIRIFFHQVYRDIWFNRWAYVEGGDLDDYLSRPLGKFTDKAKARQLCAEHVESITNISDERELLLNLISSMFGVVGRSLRSRTSVDEPRQAKRIADTRSFKKYFMLKVPESELASGDVERELARWHSTPDDQKEGVIRGTLEEAERIGKLPVFVEALLSTYIGRIEQAVAIPLVTALWKNIGLFFGKVGDRAWYDTSLLLRRKYGGALSLIMKLLNETIEPNRIERMLEHLISACSSVPFSAGILKQCQNADNPNVNQAIDLQKLKSFTLRRFKAEYIEAGVNLLELQDDDDRRLIFWLWGQLADTDHERCILKGYVLSLVHERPRALVKLLNHLLIQRFGHYELDLEGPIKIYGLSGLEYIARCNVESEALTEEEKQTVERFLEALVKLKTTNQSETSPDVGLACNNSIQLWRE